MFPSLSALWCLFGKWRHRSGWSVSIHDAPAASGLEECLSLADFVIPKEKGIGSVGLFCLKVQDDHQCNDCRDFEHLLRGSLCARLAEACAEWMQEQVNEGTHVIRPAFGYPTCPDHAMKKLAFDILELLPRSGFASRKDIPFTPRQACAGCWFLTPKRNISAYNIEIR